MKFDSGQESNVSLRHLAPLPPLLKTTKIIEQTVSPTDSTVEQSLESIAVEDENNSDNSGNLTEEPELRRSTRISKPPERLQYF